VLQRNEIGFHENFFDAGGDSILAARLHAQLERELSQAISVLDVLRYPTIAAQARCFRNSVSSDGSIARAKAKANRRQALEARIHASVGRRME
jgi:hypothetical protein